MGKTIPKISFCIIVLNGEPFTRYCLRSLYPYAHEIIVVEGAVKNAAAIATPDGHSTDGTLEVLRRFKETEDPGDKLRIVTTDGFWPEKDAMSEAYFAQVTGDYLWHVDIDEFYLPRDVAFVLNMLTREPDITAVSFMHYAFWGSPRYHAGSTYLMREGGEFHRLFRVEPGYRLATHRPVTVVDDCGVNLRDRKWIRGRQLETLGVMLYHYTLLFPQQVRDKVAYYGTWSLERCGRLKEWMERNYFGLQDPFNLFTVNDHPGWLERYEGPHPPQVEAMMRDIDNRVIAVETHPLRGVEALVDDPEYRRKITLLKDRARLHPHERLDLDSPFVRKEILDRGNGPRVLFLNQLDAKGGAAQIAYGLACGLQQSEGRAVFVAGAKTREDYWVMEPPGRHLDEALREAAARAGLPDYGVVSSFLLLDRLEYRQADLIHLHNQHRGYLNPLAIPLLAREKPFVWTLHDMQAFTGNCAHAFACARYAEGCGDCPDIGIYPGLVKDTTAELWRDKNDAASLFEAHLVVPSRWLGSKVEKSFLGHMPLSVIPNGIDKAVFHPVSRTKARHALGLPQDRIILAFSADGGLNNPWKGGQVLLDALKYLASRHQNLLLFNIGGDFTNPGLPMVSIPYVNDPKALALMYAAADIFAYPTLADSFGLVVLEALACGLPVVSFATGGVPEILRDGVNGLLVPANDREKFAVALDMLVRKEALRAAMRAAAADIPPRFTIEGMRDAYLAVYATARQEFEAGPRPVWEPQRVSRLVKQLARVGNRVGVRAYARARERQGAAG